MLIKVALDKEIHLFNGPVTMKALNTFAERSFKSLPAFFTFHYVDSEGDSIMVSTPEDIAMMEPVEGKVMKIFIQENEEEKFEYLPVESRVHEDFELT